VSDARSGPSTLRILHTSDVHIGDSFSRDDAINALVDLALAHQVDVMVIVGDFFDNNRVETDVAQAIVDKLRRLPVPVVVLPGNHDPLLVGTIYERVVLPDHVRVMTAPHGETVTLAELDLDIWGKPHLSYDDNRPLQGLPPRGGSTWQVALAHGQLVQSADDLRRAYLITPEEIAGSDRDYVALGHWDVQRDVSAGAVAAWYSGSPSRKAVCALVTFTRDGDERRVHVQSIGVDEG
jgi:DNA repair exonuclease SbcCD nuclease subunit